MADLFFYGTLCHVPLLHKVLGRSDVDVRPAVLPDHAAYLVDGQSFPMIQAEEGAQAEGLLVCALSDADLARLNYYEGGFVYDLRLATVLGADGALPAQVYFPNEARWRPGARWSLDDWADRWAAMTLRAADEVMARFGHVPVAQVQALWPFFCARGYAQELAATAAPQTLRSRMGMSDVRIVREHPGYDGFFRMRAFDVAHRRFDGSWGEAAPREAFVAYDAALVLPYDPSRDEVLLIEQMRYGPIVRGDPAPWVLEPIAGLVDAGEAPADCARREAVEEAGLSLGDLRPMLRTYASPGYSSEFFHCFLGLADLAGRGTQIGGLEDEHEDIRSHVVPFAHAMALIDSGEINGGPLVMMLLWLARHRTELRSAA